MELLILLASREGQLVTRSEIADRLWASEVFVDTEHGINTAIRKLRYLLRDDPVNPKFIQTVIGMGYRFIAPITTVVYADGRLSGSREPAACLGSGRGPWRSSLAAWPASPAIKEQLRLSCRTGELLRTTW